MPPTVLVVGSGGREHALCHALARSPRGPRLLCAPGNPGTGALARNVPVPVDDVDGLVNLARREAVDLVVIGPEAPLAAGLADRLAAEGVAVVGPTRAAARLESSKAFAKAFMQRHGIPTAAARTFASADYDAARAYVEAHPLPLVLKASGLAAGKGVLIPTTRAEALQGLDAILRDGAFGEAGAEVVVEAFMEGEEASVFAVTDGTDYALLASAQDHKRAFDGDRGPNTGGMGAYAPAPVVTPEVMKAVEAQIVRPTLEGMRSEGSPFRGFLYVGLMIDAAGAPRVVEYNVRLGDPEAQVVLPLYGGDFLALCEAVAAGTVCEVEVAPPEGSAAAVVLASEGYPGAYPKGRPIQGLEAVPEDVLVFHAGTALSPEGALETAGGRVLAVVGQGSELQESLKRAYAGVAAVAFEGAQHRTDIGQKGLARLQAR